MTCPHPFLPVTSTTQKCTQHTNKLSKQHTSKQCCKQPAVFIKLLPLLIPGTIGVLLCCDSNTLREITST